MKATDIDSGLIEKLLDAEFKRHEDESGRIARQIFPLMQRLVQLDEMKIVLLEEMNKLIQINREQCKAKLEKLAKEPRDA